MNVYIQFKISSVHSEWWVLLIVVEEADQMID
jgi:hypothetical protein